MVGKKIGSLVVVLFLRKSARSLLKSDRARLIPRA